MFVLALVMLGACSQPQEPAANGISALTIGGTEPAGSPGAIQWDLFAERLNQDGGDWAPRMLTAGQLGSEEQLLSGIRRGRIQLASMSSIIASTVVPELAMIYAPYLFDTLQEADYVFDHHLADYFQGRFAATDVELVGWADMGLHHVYATRPMLHPTDFAGIRFRVSASRASNAFASALGADRISMGFADIVPSLQTGLLESGENAVASYARSGIASQAGHLMLTGHSIGMNVVVANRQWWLALSEEQHAALQAALPSLEKSRRIVRDASARDLANAHSLGFEVHKLSPQQALAWREALQDTAGQLANEIGGDSHNLLSLVAEGKAAYQLAMAESSHVAGEP